MARSRLPAPFSVILTTVAWPAVNVLFAAPSNTILFLLFRCFVPDTATTFPPVTLSVTVKAAVILHTAPGPPLHLTGRATVAALTLKRPTDGKPRVPGGT